MNNPKRPSRYLIKRQATNLIDATHFSYLQGMPLTRSIDINLKRAEIRPRDFVSRFSKLFSDWLYTKSAARAFLWVAEHPPGESLNCHILIHVPADLMSEFIGHENDWIKRTGIPFNDRTKRSRKVGNPKTKTADQSEGEYLGNVEYKLAYMLKGLSPEIFEKLRIEQSLGIECKWQGVIYGPRCGTSESIGRAARLAGWYDPATNNLILRDRVHLQ